MATIGGTRALYSAQRQFKEGLNALFKQVTERATGLILAAGNEEGAIDPQRLPDLKRRIGDLVQSVFTPLGGQEAYTAEARPLSPYAELLNRWLAYAVASVVDAHATFLRRALPDDVQLWVTTTTTFESLQEAFNPLAQYDAPHTWVDPNGYVLSDRIWQAGLKTRLKIDALLSDGVRSGTSARTLAAQLEQFLLPNRASVRTKKPYGSDGSYDAMRLARSEISRAHAEASRVAAITNPFVTGLDWCLSASHPRFDICDGLATIGMDGTRLKDPYPPESAPVCVSDSHPQCLCRNQSFVTASRAEVIIDLRERMAHGDPPPLTPLSVRTMLTQLLGSYLALETLRQIAA